MKKIFSVITIALGFVFAPQIVASLNKPDAQSLVKLPAQPNATPFPNKIWPRGELSKVEKVKIEKIAQNAFANKVKNLGDTRALLIVKNGKIVFERYQTGFDSNSKFNSWSMAKSINAALFGIAMKDGKLKLDDKIKDPHWRENDKRNEITYRQALQMLDGLYWREEDYSDTIHNDAAIMLFGKGREDIVRYATSRPQKYKPGTFWNYSSGTTNIISAGISRAVAKRTIADPTGKYAYRDFIYDRLFRAISMNDTSPEFDAAGNFYASSLVSASAQDFARFGLLFLRDGVWDKNRILPEGFVDFVRSPAPAANNVAYGAGFWLSLPNHKGILPNGPYDAFSANGHEGQYIVIIPSKDLVIVRLGLSTDAGFHDAFKSWLSELVSAIN